MNIILYNFSKRKNSTLRPVSGLSVDVNLKNETSIYTPIFLLSISDIESYNYIQWSNRYYYITDIIKSNIKGVWEVNCSIDVLATYKEDIEKSSGFVLYNTNDFDIWIPDNRLSSDETPIISTSSKSLGFTDSGYFVINYLTSDNPSTLSPTGVIYIPKSSITQVSSLVMSDGFSNFLNELAKQLTDAKDALISCRYVPLNLTGHGGATMQLGSYVGETVSGYKPTQTWKYRVVIDIPWNFSDFRNAKPYTALYIYLPAYGMVELNPDILLKQETLEVNCLIDGITFEATYIIPNIGSYTCCFAQNISLGINKQDSLGTLVSAVGGVGGVAGGVASGNLLSVGAGLAGIFNASVKTISHNLGTNGSLGGIASILAANSGDIADKGKATIIAISHGTNIAPSAVADVMGRPLNQIRTIGALSGYVQTADFSVNSKAPDNLKFEINNYMNGGVYIE